MSGDLRHTRTLLANVSLLSVSHTTSRVLHLALIAMIGRRLGPEALSGYVMACALGPLTVLVSECGLSPWLARELAANRSNRLVRDALGVKAALTPLAVALGALALWLVPAVDPELGLLMIAAGVAESLSVLNNAICQGRSQMSAVAVAAFTQTLVWTGTGFAAAYYRAPLYVFGVGALAGSMAELIVSAAFASRLAHIGLSRPRVSTLRAASPYIVTSLRAAGVRQLDALLLGAVARSDVAAPYAAASRLLYGLAYFPHLFATAAVPYAAQAFVRGTSTFREAAGLITRMAVLASGLGVLVFVPFSPRIVAAVYGPGFEALPRLLSIGAVFLALRSFRTGLATAVTGAGQQLKSTQSSLTGVAAAAIGLVLFAQWLGAPGATASLVLGEVVAVAFLLGTRLVAFDAAFWRATAFTIVALMALLPVIVARGSVPLEVVGGAVIYCAGAMVMANLHSARNARAVQAAARVVSGP